MLPLLLLLLLLLRGRERRPLVAGIIECSNVAAAQDRLLDLDASLNLDSTDEEIAVVLVDSEDLAALIVDRREIQEHLAVGNEFSHDGPGRRGRWLRE